MAVKLRGITDGKIALKNVVTITLPAGTVSGDYAVVLATANSTVAAWSTPEGWELLGESTRTNEAGGKHSWAIFVRKLTGATGVNLPTLKSSVEATLEYTCGVAEVGTYDTTTPIDTHSAGWQESAGAEAVEVTMSGGTASVAGDLLFLFLSQTQVPTTPPTGFTKDVEGANAMFYHKLEAASGAIVVAVTKNSKTAYNGFLVAIKATTSEGALLPMLV